MYSSRTAEYVYGLASGTGYVRRPKSAYVASVACRLQQHGTINYVGEWCPPTCHYGCPPAPARNSKSCVETSRQPAPLLRVPHHHLQLPPPPPIETGRVLACKDGCTARLKPTAPHTSGYQNHRGHSLRPDYVGHCTTDLSDTKKLYKRDEATAVKDVDSVRVNRKLKSCEVIQQRRSRSRYRRGCPAVASYRTPLTKEQSTPFVQQPDSQQSLGFKNSLSKMLHDFEQVVIHIM